MASDKRASELPVRETIDGSEMIPVVADGDNFIIPSSLFKEQGDKAVEVASRASVVLDFGNDCTRAEWYALCGDIEITEVMTANVADARIYAGNGEQPLATGLAIADGTKVVVEIDRESDGDVATIGIAYKYILP